MKTWLDLGGAFVAGLLVYTIVSAFIDLPRLVFPGIAALFIVVPTTFFLLYELWHMIKQRKWYWLMASVVLAPFTTVAYYLVVHRKMLVSA